MEDGGKSDKNSIQQLTVWNYFIDMINALILGNFETFLIFEVVEVKDSEIWEKKSLPTVSNVNSKGILQSIDNGPIDLSKYRYFP